MNDKPGGITTIVPGQVFAKLPASALIPPKSIEQKTLEVLERIERFLYERFDDDYSSGIAGDVTDVITKITPTPTPFLEKVAKKRKGK